LKPFAEGIESKDGAEPTLKWAHIDIAGVMEVRLFIIIIIIVS
jgi:aminopeptidase